MSISVNGENLRAAAAAGVSGHQQTLPERDYRRSLGKRALLMVAALIVYSVAEVLAKLTLVVHWLFALATGRPNQRLLEAGDRLSMFIYQLWRYLLFCREVPPWPLDRFAQRRFSA